MIAITMLSILFSFIHPEIEWVSEKKINNINIQSEYKITDKDYKAIYTIYSNSNKLFFNNFEKIDKRVCNLSDLNVRIISPNYINDNKIFKDNKKDVYGRYFWKQNILYITYDMFNNNEYLAHELAHYFYDECVLFRGIENEENSAYRFQELYMRTYE